MICPSCDKPVEKLRRGGLCPECRAPLKKIKREDKNGNQVFDLTFRKAKAKQRIAEVDETEEVDEEYTTIYDNDGVRIEKSNLNNYITTYYRRMHFNWVYCPNCESKLSWNNKVQGSTEHKCKSCKSVTTFFFSA